jgi:AAA family ATP:ADP antiporter
LGVCRRQARIPQVAGDIGEVVNEGITVDRARGADRSAWAPLLKLLRLFGDVRDGEAATVLLLMLNIFVTLAGYYVCKTVREPLILTSGGAELKSYAAAGQALLLMGFVPLYSWFASRVDRVRLLLGFLAFFIVNLELFWLAGTANVPYIGIAFFVWVGIFSNAVIAQFWSYGNDLFDKPVGERLFPVVGIGMTLGSPFGAAFAERLFKAGVNPYALLQVAVVCLAVSMGLYWGIERRAGGGRIQTAAPLRESGNGFALLAKSPYLGTICLLLLVLNLVNTTGEYILSSAVVERANQLAQTDPAFNKSTYIGAFYGGYFFWVNVIAVVLQGFVASRLVNRFGLGGVLFVLPFVALGAYGAIAFGAGFGVIRMAKTAENATDYSIMNVARQLLWLPTSREEKYKAKQAADTFVVRAGDVFAAVLVWVGTTMLAIGPKGFAFVNIVLVGVWLSLAYVLIRGYRQRTAQTQSAA